MTASEQDSNENEVLESYHHKMKKRLYACQKVLQNQSYLCCHLLHQKKIKKILCESLEGKKDSDEFLTLSIQHENDYDDIITLIKGSVKIKSIYHT